MKRRSMAGKIALLTLVGVVAIGGGTASADRLLTGRDIQDGTVTGADVADGSITADDLAPSVATGARVKPAKSGVRGPRGKRGKRGKRGATGARGPAGSGLAVTYRTDITDQGARVIFNRAGLQLKATCGTTSDDFKVIALATRDNAFYSATQVGGPQGVLVDSKFDATVGDQYNVIGSAAGTGAKTHQGQIVYSPSRSHSAMTVSYASYYTATNGLSAHGNCSFLAVVTVGPGV